MKLLPLVLSMILLGLPVMAQRAVKVKPHTTKDGTYVPGHERTAPNKNKDDNWSKKGNTNPNTGKKGSQK